MSTSLPRQSVCVATGLAVLSISLAACGGSDEPMPPVANATLRVSRDAAPLGSPIDLTYKFVVAADARFDEDYRVMMHVVDTDAELMWTDDHDPPKPTSQWKAGETVEYTRTRFVPIYPYVGEATLHLGLYSLKTQTRLALEGEDVGQRAYRVGRLQLQPQSENVFTVFKDGWHPAEVAEQNAGVSWQWTRKQATLAFRNPGKDATFFLDVDQPAGVFSENQQVTVTLGATTVDQFEVAPGTELLRRIPLKADQMGSAEMTEVQVTVDKTFVPMQISGGASKDPRELGIRVFHAFIDPAR